MHSRHLTERGKGWWGEGFSYVPLNPIEHLLSTAEPVNVK